MGLMILYRVAYQLQNKRYLGCRIFAVEFNENDDENENKDSARSLGASLCRDDTLNSKH